MNHAQLTMPFKRYQMQPVWRADRPQKGRYREFYQCDADVVGSSSLLNELELTHIYASVFEKLKLPIEIRINSRKILVALATVCGGADKMIDITVAIDKLDKIGWEKVQEELLQRGFENASLARLEPLVNLEEGVSTRIEVLREFLKNSPSGIQGLEELEEVFGLLERMGTNLDHVDFDPMLARGLSYYTGAIFEVSAPQKVQMGSIGGGGRYDDLTGIFGLKDVSGVGISFGLDRIYLVLEELGLFPETVTKTIDVLFINFGEKEALFSLKAIKHLRKNNVNAELYPEAAKMKKQMTYANKRKVPFVVLVGEQEMTSNRYTLKNMITGDQNQVTLDALVNYIT